MSQYSTDERALDSRARHAAKRAGLIARKSQWRYGTCDNLGGFQLTTPDNAVVQGGQYELTAHDVLAFLEQEAAIAT
jgi:hypothetical protein